MPKDKEGHGATKKNPERVRAKGTEGKRPRKGGTGNSSGRASPSDCRGEIQKWRVTDIGKR